MFRFCPVMGKIRFLVEIQWLTKPSSIPSQQVQLKRMCQLPTVTTRWVSHHPAGVAGLTGSRVRCESLCYVIAVRCCVAFLLGINKELAWKELPWKVWHDLNTEPVSCEYPVKWGCGEEKRVLCWGGQCGSSGWDRKPSVWPWHLACTLN